MASMISYIMNLGEQFYVVRKILSIIAVLGEIHVKDWWAFFFLLHPFLFFHPQLLHPRLRPPRSFAFIYRFIKLSSSTFAPQNNDVLVFTIVFHSTNKEKVSRSFLQI